MTKQKDQEKVEEETKKIKLEEQKQQESVGMVKTSQYIYKSIGWMLLIAKHILNGFTSAFLKSKIEHT